MGLLDQMGGMLNGQGGQELLRRMAGGRANLSDPNSSDAQGMHQMIGGANRDELAASLTHAAQQMSPQEYHDHITPGVGGSDPLGGLGGGQLSTIASALLNHLGASGSGLGSLLGRIPGLHTAGPNRMDASQVAALAHFARQHHPDAFGRAAAEVGQRQPALLQRLLGHKAFAAAAAGLASRFMNRS